MRPNKLHQSTEEIYAANQAANIQGMRKDANINASNTQGILEEIRDKEVPEFPTEIATKTEIVGNRDEVASAFFSMLRGDKGDQGEVGPMGPQGEQGPRGESGQSIEGPQGVQGFTGEKGEQGEKGETGDRGLPGEDGNDGKDGSPDTGDEIIGKINEAENSILPKKIDGLEKMMKSVEDRDRNPVGGAIGVGGGPSKLKDLQDVRLTSPTDNQSLTYDSATGKWVNETVSGGSGTVETIVAGNNIDVDATDPANPIVSVETLTLADVSDVTASVTELNYIDGVTSALQTQLDGKQPLDSDLTTIAGLAPSNDDIMQRKAGAWAFRSPAQVTADLSQMVGDSGAGGTKGLVPAPAAGDAAAAKFLKADGTWTAPSGSGNVTKVGTPVNNQIGVWTGDGTIEGDANLTYDGTSLNLATAKNLQIAGATVLADAAGTTTLSNIDALDATTEATIEGAIDTLANLTSIQGRTVTLADAGANAIFGWDDVAGAYENLTQAEARTVLGLGTAALVATDLADLNEATIESAIDTLPNLTAAAALNTINTTHTGVLRADAGVLSVDSDVTDIVAAASTAAAGKVELATDAETNTGTDTARAITPSNLEAWTGSAQITTVGTLASPAMTTPNIGTPSAGTLTNCTGLPVNGIVDDTSSALGVGTLELGHASDTTLSRSAAGTLAVEGVDVLTTSNTKTVTNKTLTSPTINASTLTGNQNIAALPASDHTANGPTTSIFNLGATVALMEAVYLGSGGKWLLTDASATGTADKMLGICLDGGVDTDTTTVALAGSFVRDDTWAWTVGGAIYLSETAGALTQTAPTTTDAVIRVVGYATSADTLWFMPETGVVHT